MVESKEDVDRNLKRRDFDNDCGLTAGTVLCFGVR